MVLKWEMIADSITFLVHLISLCTQSSKIQQPYQIESIMIQIQKFPVEEISLTKHFLKARNVTTYFT